MGQNESTVTMIDDQKSPSPLDVRCETWGDLLVVSLSGELDMAARGLLQASTPWREAGVGRVVIDLTGVDFMDSTGLADIILLRAEADDERGIPVTVRRPQPHVRRVFEMTGLDGMITDD